MADTKYIVRTTSSREQDTTNSPVEKACFRTRGGGWGRRPLASRTGGYWCGSEENRSFKGRTNQMEEFTCKVEKWGRPKGKGGCPAVSGVRRETGKSKTPGIDSDAKRNGKKLTPHDMRSTPGPEKRAKNRQRPQLRNSKECPITKRLLQKGRQKN